MSVIRNVPIARKFSLAFGLICLLCLGLGGYSFITLRSIAVKNQDMSANAFPSLVALQQIRGAITTLRRADLDILLCQSPECIAKYKAMRDEALNDLPKAAKVYEPLISYPGERDLYQKFNAAFASYRETSERGVAMAEGGKPGDALDALGGEATIHLFTEATNAISDDINLNAAEGIKEARETSVISERATWINLVARLTIVVLCGLIGFILTHVIAPRIGRANEALQRVARRT